MEISKISYMNYTFHLRRIISRLHQRIHQFLRPCEKTVRTQLFHKETFEE